MLLRAFVSRYLGWCPSAEAVAAKIGEEKVGRSLTVMLIACSAFSSVYLIALRPVPGVPGLDIYAEIWAQDDAIAGRDIRWPRSSTVLWEESEIHYSEAVGKDVQLSIIARSTRSEELWLYGACQILEGEERLVSISFPTFPCLIHRYVTGVSYNPSVGGLSCKLNGLKSPGTVKLRLSYGILDTNSKLVTNGTREVIIQVVEK